MLHLIMNGKRVSVEITINIPSAINKVKQHDQAGTKSGNGGVFSLKAWMWSVWKFGKEDSNRVKFAFKIGLAVLLVSLLMLFQEPYNVFGNNIIWSIMTVVLMFEYTVGATFNRGLNRVLGSLLAGILAIGVGWIAQASGQVAEPVIIGASIFIIGTITSFMKLWPSLVRYEYGFRVALFTYCLIIVSGYRIDHGDPVKTAIGRLYAVAIGAIVTVLVNALVWPIWAGEKLHEELVNSFDSLAASLEECVRKYLEDNGPRRPEFSKIVVDEFPDEPAYRKCRSTLNSSAKLETLAVSARWEPPHGRFRILFYPWSEYVRVAAVLRFCAYEVMALYGVLHSEIQAPHTLRITFQSEIREATTLAAELVRNLGKDLSDMKRSNRTSLLKRVHSAANRLQRAIQSYWRSKHTLISHLLTSSCEPPGTNDPNLSQTLSNTSSDLPSQLSELDSSSSLENSSDQQSSQGTQQTESNYHELMRKQCNSWPTSQFVDFEGGGSVGDFLPRMQTVESTAAMSVANFTSVLIEFVARLDHLVEAVDKLSQLAVFNMT